MNKTTKTLSPIRAVPDRQRGAVLIVALALVVPLTLVATAIAERNTLDEKMAANQRDGMRALYLAESGAEQAIAKLMANGTVTMFDKVLADANNLALNSVSFGGGIYTVTLVDNNDGDGNATRDSDGRVTLVSRGDVGTANQEVTMAINRQGMPPQYAILTGKKLAISENWSFVREMQLTGANARVHSNESVDISGSPTIAGLVSSAGSVTGYLTQGGRQSNAPVAPIPHIYPADFKADANYIFTKDCRVKRASDSVVLADASSSKWHGWSCVSGDKWTMSDAAPVGGLQDGFVYVEGNAVISGDPGGEWNLTLVAEGSIEVSGNPNFKAFGRDVTDPHAASLRPEVKDLLFVAGADLKISGNSSSQRFDGVMGAHMEVAISGDPNYAGQIIAENGASQEITTGQAYRNLVDGNSFSGNPSHTNSLSGSPWAPAGIGKISWHESI